MTTRLEKYNCYAQNYDQTGDSGKEWLQMQSKSSLVNDPDSVPSTPLIRGCKKLLRTSSFLLTLAEVSRMMIIAKSSQDLAWHDNSFSDAIQMCLFLVNRFLRIDVVSLMYFDCWCQCLLLPSTSSWSSSSPDSVFLSNLTKPGKIDFRLKSVITKSDSRKRRGKRSIACKRRKSLSVDERRNKWPNA